MSVQIGVVVVTYQPAGEVEARLTAMASQGGLMVVVDNASDEPMRGELREMCDRHGWMFLANDANLGVGAALNRGVRHLAEAGAQWALLFDQDSNPPAGMAERVLSASSRHAKVESVAVVGAGFVDAGTGRMHRVLGKSRALPFLFRKVPPVEGEFSEVSMVITSGSLARVRYFVELGGFDEGLFIDYVDTDFCLRCLERGLVVGAVGETRFEHRLGERTIRTFLGFKIQPTNHSALRHYYIARNRIHMWRRHSVRVPHWAVFDACCTVLWLARIICAETMRRKKLLAMWLGTLAGLAGRLGPCPVSVEGRLRR